MFLNLLMTLCSNESQITTHPRSTPDLKNYSLGQEKKNANVIEIQ